MERIEATALGFAALLVMGLVAITAADVVGRYFLNRALGWAYDGALVLMVGLGFVALAAVQRRNGHVSVQIIHKLLPLPLRRLAAGLHLAVGGGAFGVIAWANAVYSLNAWRSGWVYGGLGFIPTWIPYSFITLGSLFLVCRMLLQIVAVLRGARSARAVIDGPDDEAGA